MQNEIFLQFIENEQTKEEKKSAAGDTAEPCVRTGNVTEHNQVSKDIDIMIHGIEFHNPEQVTWKGIQRVENRGSVHPG